MLMILKLTINQSQRKLVKRKRFREWRLLKLIGFVINFKTASKTDDESNYLLNGFICIFIYSFIQESYFMGMQPYAQHEPAAKPANSANPKTYNSF